MAGRGAPREPLPNRVDIQFMRGMAVLAVVIYHAFPAAFPQGFLGVDVFFVISGFLTTGIILKGLEAGRFSFGGFHRRRALHLLPASLAVATALVFVLLTVACSSSSRRPALIHPWAADGVAAQPANGGAPQ